jgi:hypothetical protein
LAVDFTRSARLIPETTRRDVGDEKRYSQDPFFVCTSIAEPAISPLSAASQFKYVFRGHLTLQHVVTEFKKQSDDEGKALNQGRKYFVSLVAFYSALPTDDYAFYCIVTSGKIGTILMAWKSSKQDVRGSFFIRVPKANLLTEDPSDREKSSEVRPFHPVTGVSLRNLPFMPSGRPGEIETTR